MGTIPKQSIEETVVEGTQNPRLGSPVCTLIAMK